MAQQMLAALNALYHQDGSSIKEQASKYLEQWQASVEAWSVSDSVLHDPSSGMEAQYFCAQTLRTKVQRDFEELPASAIDSLRDSLMTLLLRYAKGPPPVRTQLCLALVAMTVHVPADRWAAPPGVAMPDSLAGGGAVAWFAVSLQRAPAEDALPCLLELLTVLPQEVNSLKYAVRPERRRQHAQELRAATGAAINILTGCLSSPGVGPGSERLRPRLLEAFGGWLRLSEGAALGPDGSQLPSHPLVVACLEGLRSSSDLFHAACDAVCELVWCTVDHSNGAVDPGMMPLIQALVPAVMALRPRFAVASRRAAEELAEEEGEPHRGPTPPATDEFDDDEHTAKGMARLFAEVGEAYVHLIATAVQEVQAPVEALLEVAGHPEPSLASMSFNFWHRLARSFTSGWGPKSMAGSRSNSSMDVALEATPEGQAALAEQARRRAFFTPAFERLVLVVRGKVKYPAASSRWNKEQFADFRKHRYEIADSLEDCAAVLGFTRCLELLIEPLARLSADMQAGGKPFDWRAAEAALFCIRSIGPHAHSQGPGQPLQLTQLLEALPTLPQQYPLLLSCCCYTTARYAGWLSISLAAPSADGGAAGRALLSRLLDLAIMCLDVPEASSGACSAILDLCAYCGRHMGPSIPVLTQLYTRLQGSGVAAGGPGHLISANRGAAAVAEEDVQLVMQAVCIAVCKSLPADQLPAAANALLQPVLAAVQAAAGQLPAIPTQPPPGSPSLFSQHPTVGPLVDRLATLFAHFDNRKAVADMLVQSWGALDSVFSRAMRDSRLTERACRALRLAIKGAGPDGLPMLPSLLNELAARFRATRHSAFLYILSELIKIFGTEDACVASLTPVLTALVVDACSGLRTLPQLQQEPELVDDVYLLGVRTLSYSPRVLLQPLPTSPVGGLGLAPGSPSPPATAALTALLDTALLGVLMQHREACCSVLSFLVKLLNVAQAGEVPGVGELLPAVLTPRAPLLTRLLLAGVAGTLPTARLGDVATLLCALLRAFRQQALSWLAAAVASLPDAVLQPSDKEAFLGAANVVATQLEMSSQQERTWEGAVDDFADLCRRNPRVRTSAQQALLPPELAAAVVM